VATASGDYFAPTGNTNTKLVMGAAFEALPEPATITLFLAGLGVIFLQRRR